MWLVAAIGNMPGDQDPEVSAMTQKQIVIFTHLLQNPLRFFSCKILGSHGGEYEDDNHLGYVAL
jgi:hypothetical protein